MAELDAFVVWWQHLPALMDPEIFRIGNFPLRWYGTMYAVAFYVVWFLSTYRLRNEKGWPYRPEFIGDLMMWLILGVMLGARLGYVLFYDFEQFISAPWRSC